MARLGGYRQLHRRADAPLAALDHLRVDILFQEPSVVLYNESSIAVGRFDLAVVDSIPLLQKTPLASVKQSRKGQVCLERSHHG